MLTRSRLPHEGVYARLGVSSIHGVGVFAIRPIPAGTNIFSDDQSAVCWVDEAEVERLPSTLRKLYTDFAIFRDGQYGVPEHFSRVTPGWYCNEPMMGDEPNVVLGTSYDLIAKRDIDEGEELTVVYASFSAPLDRY